MLKLILNHFLCDVVKYADSKQTLGWAKVPSYLSFLRVCIFLVGLESIQ